MVKARFIMDCYGHFQIEVDGEKSQPALYDSIASLEKDGAIYFGVTEYYAGLLPTECVLKVQQVESETVDADECNMFQPDQPCTHRVK